MLELHYNYYKRTYGSNATLHFTDTDSLLYKIKSENVIRDMVEAPIQFDIVEALTDDVLEELSPDEEKQQEILKRFKEYKGKLGLLKLESGSGHISTFVGLIKKMYVFQLVTAKGEIKFTKKGKGVPGGVFKKNTKLENFLQMLNKPREPNDAREVTFSTMRSYGHNMFRQDVTKKMLSAYNDTVFDRYPLPNLSLIHI